MKLLVLYVRVKMKQNHKRNIFSTLLSLNRIEKIGRESLEQKIEQQNNLCFALKFRSQ